jgi:serine/threonine protein kinase
MLIPYEHYVPVQADLSDLLTQIQWCRDHDDECRQIAINAKTFHDTYLMKEGALDYLQKLLLELKKENGVYLYNQQTPLELQIRRESKSIDLEYPHIGKGIRDISKIPAQPRSYGLLQGMHWIVNMVNDQSTFTEVATKGRTLFSNKLTTVDEYKLAGFSFVVKTTNAPDKIQESIHEVFVCTKCINELSKYTPNFVYNFGMVQTDQQSSVIMERVVGQTLSEYIRSDDFNIPDYLFILAQLALALQVAQFRCGLVHYDLTPWNIVIQKLPRPITFDYMIDYNKVYRVKTQIIPVIIDFGKSHVIYDNTHYGDINMFNVSTIQDILSILVTSIYDITELELQHNEVRSLVTLANFLTGTKYRKREFYQTGRGGTGDLRFFLRNAKKYTQLISSNKYELEDLTPMDFLTYLNRNFKNMPIRNVNNYRFNLDRSNARQVFEFTLAGTQKKRINSYLKVFSRVRKCELPETDNLLLVYYILQSLRVNLDSVYNNMVRFLAAEKVSPEPMVAKYTKTIKHITGMYNTILRSGKMKKIRYRVDQFTRLVHAPYTQETFTNPALILEKIHEITGGDDISSYKEIIMQTLLQQGEFQIPPRVRDFYVENCKSLLMTNTLYMKNNVANGHTLRITAEEVYSTDRDVLAPKIDEEDGDCRTAEQYLALYDRILS